MRRRRNRIHPVFILLAIGAVFVFAWLRQPAHIEESVVTETARPPAYALMAADTPFRHSMRGPEVGTFEEGQLVAIVDWNGGSGMVHVHHNGLSAYVPAQALGVLLNEAKEPYN